MRVYEKVYIHNNKLHIREYDTEKNNTVTTSFSIENYLPYVYVPNKNGKYKTIDNKKIEKNKLSLKEYKEAREYIYKAKKLDNIPLKYRYGRLSIPHNYIFDNYKLPNNIPPFYKIWYLDIEVISLDNKFNHKDDWKPHRANANIVSIQIYDTKLDAFILFLLNKKAPFKEYMGKKVYSVTYSNEKEMLEGFFKYYLKAKPSVISGFNIKNYDIPYIVHRYIKLNNKNLYNEELYKVSKMLQSVTKYEEYLDLSIKYAHYFDEYQNLFDNKEFMEFLEIIKNIFKAKIGLNKFDKTNLNLLKDLKIVYKEATTSYNSKYITYNFMDTLILDYLELYQKYTFEELENWELETIVNKELGQGKIKHSQYLNFKDFYLKDFKLFIEYGLTDVLLLNELDNKLHLMDLNRLIAYITGVNADEVLGTLRQWNNFVYNEYLKHNIVLPNMSIFTNDIENNFKDYVLNLKDGIKNKSNTLGIQLLDSEDNLNEQKFQGGVVRATQRIAKNVFSVDFSSLYPNIILFYNISLEKLYIPKRSDIDLLELKRKYAIYYPKNLNADDLIILDLDFIEKLNKDKEAVKILKKHNLTMTPNGTFFKVDSMGIFPKTIDFVLTKRKYYKKIMMLIEKAIIERDKNNNIDELLKEILELSKNNLINKDNLEYYLKLYDVFQMAFKILANSAYGSLSLIGNIFAGHKEFFGGAVTSGARIANLLAGQTLNNLILNKAGLTPKDYYRYKNIKKLSNLDEVVQIDTDSNYTSLEKIIPDFDIDKILDFIDIGLKAVYDKLKFYANQLNVFDADRLKEDVETINKTFISVAPKSYTCLTVWKDGNILKTPKVKITGLPIIKKDTPPILRKKLKEAVLLLLNNKINDLVELNNNVLEELKNIKDIKELASYKRVNSLDYIYDKSENRFYKWTIQNGKKTKLTAPINSRASLIHNILLEEKKIKDVIIEAGDKVMLFKLKTPNNYLNSDIIAVKKNIFLKNEDIDFYYYYNDFYINKIKLITDKVGINITEKQINLLDF